MTLALAEKALVSLSDPLLVSDELHFSNRTGVKKVALSAGIHRQTWISGYPIFVDIQIDNQSNKSVKKVELQLERTTTYHSQPAPATIQGAVESLRIPDQIHKEVLAKEDVSHGLHGIVPVLLDFRTYQMDLPRGLVSIEMGKHIERRQLVLLLVPGLPPTCHATLILIFLEVRTLTCLKADSLGSDSF